MDQNTVQNSKTPSVLVYKLCSRLVNSTEEKVITPHYQHALTVLGSNFAASSESDEFQVAQKIKRKLVRKGREKDAAIFSELHRKLQAQNILKNRWAILHLLMNVSQDDCKPKEKLPVPAFFTPALQPVQITSTPFHPAAFPPQTPHVGNITASSKSSGIGSSGISSINPSFRSEEPTPIPQTYSHVQTFPAHPTPSFTPADPRGRLNLNSTSKEAWGPSAGGTLVKLKPRREDTDNTSSELPEAALVKDIVYTFQGIEGKYIKQGREGYKANATIGIPRATRHMVNKLVECGWLFSKVRKYTDSRAQEKTFGLVGQSFCAALHQELTEYYRLMAVLEAQLQQEQDQGIVCDLGGLTLRRLLIWTSDPLVRLKSLAALTDVCKGKKGGALASAIHSYLQHGDPFIRGLVKHTLTLVVQPIFATLTRWIYDGELDDTYHEFFVASDPSVKEDRLWHDKYSLRKSMIPSFINIEQARKILLTGKSINFLRQVCQDRTTIKNRDVVKKAMITQADSMFTQDMNNSFQKMVDTIYKETSRHLLDVLHAKYQFMDHLKAMRRYLLLGQGDFIRHLMDLLEEDLAKPAGSLYLHNLTGILETAIRATNAQFDDSDILKRLDVRLLEVSPGDTGWDVFSLDYHVDGPISTVFTPESIIMYLRVFNFLWRAKRMEYILSHIWRGQMANYKILRTLPELGPILHQCHVIASEMIHFVQQVQYYVNFEVLECSWDDLLKKVSDAGDLDHIIAAHQEFLDCIITRSLLDDESRGTILTQLRTIFDLIIQYQSIQDNMYQVANDEIEARTSFEAKKSSKTDQGNWGLTESDEIDERQRRKEVISSLVTQTRRQLRVNAQSYHDMVQSFLLMLTSHPDVSLRFLSFRLDFNEHYKSKEPKLRNSLTYQKSRSRLM